MTQSWRESVFIGFLLSLSSTAIVLKLLQERAEADSPHGRISLGILIFQDTIIIPMMLLVPLLSGKTGEPGSGVAILLAKGLLIIALVIVSAKWVVPQFFFISIGMLLNVQFLLQHPVIVLSFTVGVLLLKTLLAGSAALVLGFPLRTAVFTGPQRKGNRS
jgi:monovalent cation:H+ antiporter-2, CPA2 family